MKNYTWVSVKKNAPWRWFFTYCERAQEDGSKEFLRINKTDRLFDWICIKIKRFIK